MRKFGKTTGIILCAALLALALGTSAALAYFSDYEPAQGQVTFSFSGERTITEGTNPKEKNIQVMNNGDKTDADVVVRVGIYGPKDYTYITRDESVWADGGDGWFYYKGILAPGESTPKDTLKVEIKNKDGSDVLFVTAAGTLVEVTTSVSNEKTLWTGPEYLQWNENRVRIEAADMAQVPAGATILIYYEKLPAGHEGYYEGEEYKEYWKMKVMTAWWTDLFPEFDITDDTPQPYTFAYTAELKDLVEGQNALSVAGWGLNILKITFKE